MTTIKSREIRLISHPTGMTAWAGLYLVDVQAGETIFISGAAGAVGNVAGQLAKYRFGKAEATPTGQLKSKETVVVGIDKAVSAFLGLFTGKNIGKMVVKLE